MLRGDDDYEMLVTVLVNAFDLYGKLCMSMNLYSDHIMDSGSIPDLGSFCQTHPQIQASNLKSCSEFIL